MKRLLGMAALLMLVGTLGASPASADTVTYDLVTPNAALVGYPTPFGTVEIDLTSSTTATITFTADSYPSSTACGGGPCAYLFGTNGVAAVNVNASSWTLTLPTSSSGPAPTGWTGGASDTSFSDGGSGSEDGFGTFNQTINAFDGATRAVTSLTFTLTDTGGTWASAGDVVTPNADGFPVAAHVFAVGPDCSAGGTSSSIPGDGVCATGYATIPEPGSLSLLGTGLIALAGILRRRLAA